MTELVVPDKSFAVKESIQPNKIECNKYCRALKDFSYLIKKNNHASEIQPTSAQSVKR